MSGRSPTRSETLASLSILVLLAGIGIGILHVRKTPSPAVSVYGEVSRMPAQQAGGADPIPVPEGFSEMSPPEVFGPQTLSDKIDGKADLYLTAGFERLYTRRLRPVDRADTWLEVFAYRMEDPKSAFSVFSAQQRRGALSLSRFRYGYRSENALFFVHGSFYVEIVSSAVSPEAGFMMQAAEAFAGAHPVAETAVPERKVFPRQGLVPGSLELQSANVFGFERLDDIFLARYRFEGAEMTAFVSKRASGQEAGELAGAYADFLIRFGGRPEPVAFPAKDAKMIEIFGVYELIFAHENTLAGVHEAGDPASAVALGRRIYDHLTGGGS
jgi:hypothetical protein